MMSSIDLRVSDIVLGSREKYQSYTPSQGKKIVVKFFGAEGFYDRNSMCKLIWKFNHESESEEILWAIRGTGIMPRELIIPPSDVDGVRQLAVTCDNADLTSVIMSAWARIKVY